MILRFTIQILASTYNKNKYKKFKEYKNKLVIRSTNQILASTCNKNKEQKFKVQKNKFYIN